MQLDKMGLMVELYLQDLVVGLWNMGMFTGNDGILNESKGG